MPKDEKELREIEARKKLEEEERAKLVLEKWTCEKCGGTGWDSQLEKCGLCGGLKPPLTLLDDTPGKKGRSVSMAPALQKGKRKIVSQKDAKVQLQYTKNNIYN